jgi:elongator complex protein 3
MITSPKDFESAKDIVAALENTPGLERFEKLKVLLRQFPKNNGQTFSKSELLSLCTKDSSIRKLLLKKPVRTLSGVTPVTVLTKPFPCPGQCIFCPSDVRMPKSYIANEPGAQRAGQYEFHPYVQVWNRLQAYTEIGHPTSKVELIVLGGTWSFYPLDYQRWFISELFRAMNDFGDGIDNRPTTHQISLDEKLPPGLTYNQYISGKKSAEVVETATIEQIREHQTKNEQAVCRCVGLVLETRPDYVNPEELKRFRQYGVTKVQIGVQSLSNTVLQLNKRGHTAEQTITAIDLIRQAGFKIHIHWMPNLYGSDTKDDKQDYLQLFNSTSVCPDEIKVYPCSLIDNTELMNIFHQGLWRPYTTDELIDVLQFVMKNTPEYTRLTRIIRDIPGSEIVNGNKSTNLRQLIETKELLKELKDIRAREIKNQQIQRSDLHIDDQVYETNVSTEHFLQFIDPKRRIAGFLRLSLPKGASIFKELDKAAMIREIHVYGQSVSVGNDNETAAQHQGLGKDLIQHAVLIATEAKFEQLAVISAVGTREYYRNAGFVDGELYQVLKLQPAL